MIANLFVDVERMVRVVSVNMKEKHNSETLKVEVMNENENEKEKVKVKAFGKAGKRVTSHREVSRRERARNRVWGEYKLNEKVGYVDTRGARPKRGDKFPGVNRSALGRMLGKDRSMITRWLNGTMVPDVRNASRLSKALGLSGIEELMRKLGHKDDSED